LIDRFCAFDMLFKVRYKWT